jgi:NADH-quinone oxidoreductase subunit J
MELTVILFYVFALLTLASGVVVVFSKNVVHSAFALLFTFFGVAGLYVFLMADFLAITQLLIYVGGILVLLLFGVMLTTKVFDIQVRTGTLHILPATVVVALIATILVVLFWGTEWKMSGAPLDVTSTAPALGEKLLTTYVLPFEIASVVLVVAMIGAAMIARRDRKDRTSGRSEGGSR